jgi:hypothetical protein
MSWIICVYGGLTYRLFGAAAEARFTQSWALGVALSQAYQLRDVVLVALQGLLAVVLLESLWLQRSAAWFEAYVDYMSCHSRQLSELAGGRARRWMRRTTAYVTHFSGVRG